MQYFKKFILACIALLLIVIGFVLIFVPLPHSFEIATLYYFNPNDGVTIMDLIALVLILCGVYILLQLRDAKKN